MKKVEIVGITLSQFIDFDGSIKFNQIWLVTNQIGIEPNDEIIIKDYNTISNGVVEETKITNNQTLIKLK